jgi:hypothetical protein
MRRSCAQMFPPYCSTCLYTSSRKPSRPGPSRAHAAAASLGRGAGEAEKTWGPCSRTGNKSPGLTAVEAQSRVQQVGQLAHTRQVTGKRRRGAHATK